MLRGRERGAVECWLEEETEEERDEEEEEVPVHATPNIDIAFERGRRYETVGWV